MGAFDFFKSWVGGGSSVSGHGARACIVDVSGLAGGTRVPPKLKIQALQRLSRFARTESVKVIAVVDGEELRAAVHGSDFEGIKVYYAERSANMGAALQEAAKHQPDAVVVTDNQEAEALVRGQGAATMRLSTFRKAFEAPRGDEAKGDERGRNSGRRDRDRERRPRGRGPRRGNRGERNAGERERPPRRERSEPRESDAQQESRDPVSDLIDLV